MTTIRWITTDTKWCDLINLDVTLEERREFSSGSETDIGHYLVTAQRCSADVFCNLAGVPCSGAYLNPDVNRFALDKTG